MVAWGDVPTWLTAGVAFAALLGAFYAYRKQDEQLRVQAEQLRLQRVQLADETRIREREQANQIDVIARTVTKATEQSWLSRHEGEFEHPHAHAVMVTNASKRPIRDVACRVEVGPNDGATRELGLGDGVHGYMHRTDAGQRFSESGGGSTMSVLRAGWQAGFAWSGTAEYPRIVPTVRFTDDAGLHWEVDIYLHLEKLAKRDW